MQLCSCSAVCAESAAAVRRPGRDVRARARRARAAARRACACAHSPSPHSGLRPAAAATSREMPQLRKGHYTWRTCAHMVVSLFDVGHVSKRHLVFDHLLAFCGFWLVSSVSIRHVSPLAHVALWRGPRVVFDGWRTWYSPRASWFVPQRSSRSRHVAYTSHVSSDTWFAHSSARLAHVANVLHVVFFLTAAAARSHTHTVDAARGDTHTV